MTRALTLKRIRFGEFLIERQVLSEGQLLDCLAVHWESGCRVGDAACERGYAGRLVVERAAREYQSLHTIYV
ncbi:MAG: hypothetical protein AABZ30_08225 [Myxococcota bacterium]